MLERLLTAAGPPDDAQVRAVMLAMALLAGLTAVLLAVEPGAGGDPRAEVRVALVRAQLVADALAGRVAIAAVLVSFEARMGLRQGAGAQELRAGGRGEEADAEERDDACEPSYEPQPQLTSRDRAGHLAKIHRYP